MKIGKRHNMRFRESIFVEKSQKEVNIGIHRHLGQSIDVGYIFISLDGPSRESHRHAFTRGPTRSLREKSRYP